MDMAGKPLGELAATIADRVPACAGEDGQFVTGEALALRCKPIGICGEVQRQSGGNLAFVQARERLRCQAARRIAVLMGNVNRDH